MWNFFVMAFRSLFSIAVFGFYFMIFFPAQAITTTYFHIDPEK